MTPLIQLRTFVEVYRARSISRAAATLGITQPAASAHIRTLEDQIGRTLFRRHARGVDASATADELAAAVAPGLEELETAFSALRARAEAVVGTIRIAGPSEFMRARMVTPLARLSAVGLSVRVTLGGRRSIYGAMRDGDVDLGITASRPRDPELGYTEIAEEKLVAVASPSWVARRLDGKRRLNDVLQHPVVAYDDSLPLIDRTVEAIGEDPARLRTVAVTPDLRMVCDLVEAGCGWSVLPDYLVEERLKQRRLVVLAVQGPAVKNRIYLAWPKAALRHPRVSYARQALLEQFA